MKEDKKKEFEHEKNDNEKKKKGVSDFCVRV